MDSVTRKAIRKNGEVRRDQRARELAAGWIAVSCQCYVDDADQLREFAKQLRAKRGG